MAEEKVNDTLKEIEQCIEGIKSNNPLEKEINTRMFKRLVDELFCEVLE
jgi:hypothetical protein